jgi:glycosyltransferase involved in cell wall biosynthesis
MTTLHQILVSPLVGGAGIVAIRLAAAATRAGLGCIAWVPGRGPAAEALDRAGVRSRTYDLEGMKGSSAQHVLACLQMLPGLAARHRPLVHVHGPVVYRFVRPALTLTRAHAIVHFHIEPTPEEVRWALERPPDHVVACAEYIASTIRSVLAQSGTHVPVSAIPNAIDLERFAPGSRDAARRVVGLATNRFVILMMANLAPHKGQVTAIRALHELTRRGIEAECWLAGEDRSGGREYETSLRALSNELGVQSRVRFLGFRQDGPDLLRSADLLALPSTHEGLPLTVLEAQAAGIPVLASVIPGNLEVIKDGITGFTLPAEDWCAFADRAQQLASDPELRRRIVDAALTAVRSRHGWPNFQQRAFAVYQTLAPDLFLPAFGSTAALNVGTDSPKRS